MLKLFTIGHSAHPIEKFIELLKLHHIHMLVDVRSVPASRFYPQFRKRALTRTLAEQDIQYVFLGQQLGGRPTDPTCYKDGLLPEKHQKPWPKPDYAKVMQREWFIGGIEFSQPIGGMIWVKCLKIVI
ncbi:MAG: DUF488 domain-containing protein [Desulfobacteraceae bacterium]|jgi:hypothetical protein